MAAFTAILKHLLICSVKSCAPDVGSSFPIKHTVYKSFSPPLSSIGPSQDLNACSLMQIFFSPCHYLTSYTSPLISLLLTSPYLCFLLSVSSFALLESVSAQLITLLRLSLRLTTHLGFSYWRLCQVLCTKSCPCGYPWDPWPRRTSHPPIPWYQKPNLSRTVIHHLQSHPSMSQKLLPRQMQRLRILLQL